MEHRFGTSVRLGWLCQHWRNASSISDQIHPELARHSLFGQLENGKEAEKPEKLSGFCKEGDLKQNFEEASIGTVMPVSSHCTTVSETPSCPSVHCVYLPSTGK